MPKRHRPNESQDFTCVHCKLRVPGGQSAQAWGTKHRNHCPACLHSRHLDITPGDCASPCRAPMAPIAIAVRDGDTSRAEWTIVHRCTRCHTITTNRIAGDDSERALLALALRPLATPPFPLDDIRS